MMEVDLVQQRQKYLELQGRLDLSEFDDIFREINDIETDTNLSLEVISGISEKDSEVLKIDLDSFKLMASNLPALKKYFGDYLQRNLKNLKKVLTVE